MAERAVSDRLSRRGFLYIGVGAVAVLAGADRLARRLSPPAEVDYTDPLVHYP